MMKSGQNEIDLAVEFNDKVPRQNSPGQNSPDK